VRGGKGGMGIIVVGIYIYLTLYAYPHRHVLVHPKEYMGATQHIV